MGLLSFVGKLLGVSGGPQQKIEISKTSAAEGLPIIYGKRRLEAINVFKRVSSNNITATSGTYPGTNFVLAGAGTSDNDIDRPNVWLHRIDVWGQGEINAVRRFWIDGDLHTHKRFNARPYFRAITKYGADGQTAFSALSAVPSTWSADHKGNGVAYSWSRFLNSKNKPQFNAEPVLRAEIEGLKLYDPRLDNSVAGGSGSHSFDDAGTWAYGNNRALVVLNYLMSPFGFNAPKAELDLESFIVAADLCDQSMDIPAPAVNTSGVPQFCYNAETGEIDTIVVNQRYPCNRIEQLTGSTTQQQFVADAVLDPKDGVVDNLKVLLEEFGWSLSWSNGRHRLVIEDDVAAPAMTFDATSIFGGWNIERGNRSQRYNRVTVEFPNANKDYESDTVSWPPLRGEQHNIYLVEDGGRDLHANLTLKTVTDFYRAEAYAEFAVKKSRVNERITGLQLAPKAMLLEPGDVIAIDYAEKGFDPAENLYFVEKINISSTLDVTVDLRAYDGRLYGATVRVPEPPNIRERGLDPWVDPDAITNLQAQEYHTSKADGSVISGIYLTWDAPASGVAVERIEVKWRDINDSELPSVDDSGYPDVQYAGRAVLPAEAVAHKIENLTDDKLYRVIVSYVTRLSQRSIEAILDVNLAETTVSKLKNIEEGATDGASIGTNLFDSDGFLVDAGDVVTADGQLTMGHLWDFKWSTLGWSGVNMVTQGVPQGIHVTPTTSDGQLISPDNLNIDGALYDKVAVRMKRVVQGEGDFFEFPVLLYETESHGFSGSYKRTRSLRFGDGNARTFVFDMANLTVGGDDWINSTIKRLRFDPSVTLGDTFEIDWIGVGRVSAPAQEALSANLADEIQFADIAVLDTDNLEVFGKVELADTSLKIGDQVSAACEVQSLDDRRGQLEIIFEQADTTDIEAYTSQYSQANTASYQQVSIEGLIIPPGTELIRYRLLREAGKFGAVGGRRPSLNKGPGSIDWYGVRSDVEQNANYITGTNQLSDNAGLGDTAQWYGITGSGRPADNATRNMGALANLDAVGESQILDGSASDRPMADKGADSDLPINGGVRISEHMSVVRQPEGQLIVGTARIRLSGPESIETLRLEIRRGTSTVMNVLPVEVTDNYYTYTLMYWDRGSSGSTTYHLRVSTVGNVLLDIDVDFAEMSALVLKK
ncbi:phage tail protein [Kordiimonas aquimaris]|uniref:phage tail protein n=1 Tax=Kordiimonas aquimaris TaxID=707591 RepID=UPI0021CF9715|nr:phage tail protein [Kordiimonas aquimaris]